MLFLLFLFYPPDYSGKKPSKRGGGGGFSNVNEKKQLMKAQIYRNVKKFNKDSRQFSR
jgi:hypothetical protein